MPYTLGVMLPTLAQPALDRAANAGADVRACWDALASRRAMTNGTVVLTGIFAHVTKAGSG